MVVNQVRVDLLQKLDAKLPSVHGLFMQGNVGLMALLFASGSVEKFATTLYQWGGNNDWDRNASLEVIDFVHRMCAIPDGESIVEWLADVDHEGARRVLADINEFLDHVFEEDFR